jgi:hypothetical protein
MTEKLDPALLAMAEEAASDGSRREVVVLVGLRAPAEPEQIAQMEALGLTPRSTLGDILTGKIAIENLNRLAAHPLVVKVEASGPLFREERSSARTDID